MSTVRSMLPIPTGARGARSLGFLVAVAALWSAGCGSGPTYYDVQGSVTANGKPVEYAEMHIHPTSEGANRGRTVNVHIVNGKYDTRPLGGVPAGPAEWTIAVPEPGTMRIKDPSNISPEESERFLRAKKKVVVKEIEVNGDEVNIDLP